MQKSQKDQGVPEDTENGPKLGHDHQQKKNMLLAWSKVVGTHLIYISSWGLLNAYGSYVTYYDSDLLAGYSATDIAWPGTLQAVLIISTGVVAGPLFDRGYIRTLLIGGSFMIVFGMMMLSLSTQYYQIILSQGLCVGLGSGLVYVPSLALVSVTFQEGRALAIGIATCGAAVGGVIYPIALYHLLPLVGFAWATRILAFMALFTLVAGVVLVLWDSENAIQPKPPRAFIDTEALKEPPFMVFCLIAFLIFLAYYIPFFYIPTYAEIGLASSQKWAVYLLAITNASTFPTRIAAAWVADRIGALNTLFVTTAAAAVVLLCWFGVSSLAGFDIWVIGWGLTAGPLISLPAAVIPLLSPSLSVVGTRMGMAWLSAAMGGLVGAPVAGVLNKIGGDDFVATKGLIGASITAATILLGWLRWRGIETKGKWKI